ncbi:MAG: sulfite exporter TauE/SafE family protein [Tepidiformaceae bacterium]
MTRVFDKKRLARILAVALAAVIASLPLLPQGTAYAHPLGNFTINRYARLEIYRDAVQIHYVVDMAEIPTFQLIGEIDSDGDGRASQAELDGYAAKERETLAKNFVLSVGGKRVEPKAVETSVQLLPGQGGLQTTRLAVVYDARTPEGLAGSTEITFKDGNFAERAGWKEIVVRPSDGAVVGVDQRLTVDSSDALRNYPAETLKAAPDVREAAFTWTVGSGETAPATATLQKVSGGRATSGFAGLLHHDRSLGIILLSLMAAFGFGALHALGPGHGKTVVAAYLVGSKGTPRHAVALGLTVTATHTSTVYLLGFITLSASAFILPETLYLYLGVASGAMVVLMGGTLLANRLWRAYRPSNESAHRHGLFGKAHSHLPEAHEHDDGPHEHADGGMHEHPHVAASVVTTKNAKGSVTWRSLLTLGVAGGLLPCPSAIVVMLTAISLGQVFFGMLLIVAFSLGLATVLTTIGIALTAGKRLTGRFGGSKLAASPGFRRAATALPLISALGITLAGLAITYQSWNQPGL